MNWREALLKLQRLQVELYIKVSCSPASSLLLKQATALWFVYKCTADDTQSLPWLLPPPWCPAGNSEGPFLLCGEWYETTLVFLPPKRLVRLQGGSKRRSSAMPLPFFWGGRAARGPRRVRLGLCSSCLWIAVFLQALCLSQNLQTSRASGAPVGCEPVLWGGGEPPYWAAWGRMVPGEHRAAAACAPRMAASLGGGHASQLGALRAWWMRFRGAGSGSWAPPNDAKARGMTETTVALEMSFCGHEQEVAGWGEVMKSPSIGYGCFLASCNTQDFLFSFFEKKTKHSRKGAEEAEKMGNA